MGGFFINKLAESPWEFFSWVIVVAFSICVHELFHAWVALKCGDDTAARAGHLTLNPLVQMGVQSLIMLALLGIAWGMVPVNPAALRPMQRAKVAFAGPAANLALSAAFALVAVLTWRFTAQGSEPSPAISLMLMASRANAVLFILNMLPVPSFDGWSVLGGFFPALEDWTARFGPQAGWIALAVLFLTPASVLVWVGGEAISRLFVRGLAAAVGLV